VIDGSTHKVIATEPVGYNPDAVAVDPETRTVYVTDYGDHIVSVIKAR
jgi:DNA-binding beta-propeller fold protein YncE